jgi:hypothetical protein
MELSGVILLYCFHWANVACPVEASYDCTETADQKFREKLLFFAALGNPPRTKQKKPQTCKVCGFFEIWLPGPDSNQRPID